jgi:hypothetical protein
MPSEVTKRLRDRRLQVWEECKATADTAAENNRAFVKSSAVPVSSGSCAVPSGRLNSSE